MKSDTSIRNISVAAIKRHTIKPYDFQLSRFFDVELCSQLDEKVYQQLTVTADELPIAQVFLNADNFTLVTTRQIITCQQGIVKIAPPQDVTAWAWNNFKSDKYSSFTWGKLTLTDNSEVEVLIETGKASMIMIYAIMTLVQQLQ